MRGSERTEKPTDSRRSKEERREARELQQTGTRYKESLQQIIHRPPDQAAGEPPEQATRSQV